MPSPYWHRRTEKRRAHAIMVDMPGPVHARSGAGRSGAWIWLVVAGLAGAALAVAIASAVNPAGGSDAQAEVSASPSASESVPASITPSPSPTEAPEVPTVTFTFAAAGDVLTHAPVNDSATNGGVLDYSPLIANTAPYVSGADFAICPAGCACP